MKLKCRFLIREVAGQSVAVPVGQGTVSFHGMIRLNSSGAFLMELLNTGSRSEQELLSALLEKYDVSQIRAQSTLEAFLEQLREAGLLTE